MLRVKKTTYADNRFTQTNYDAADRVDPSGHESLAELAITTAVVSTLALQSLTLFTALSNAATADFKIDGYLISLRATLNGLGGTAGAGADIIYDFASSKWWVSLVDEIGTAPLSIFEKQRGAGATVAFGPVFGMTNPNELSGRGVSGTIPFSIIHLLPGALFSGNKAWGAMTQLAKR